jgi:hypothetical protein
MRLALAGACRDANAPGPHVRGKCPSMISADPRMVVFEDLAGCNGCLVHIHEGRSSWPKTVRSRF